MSDHEITVETGSGKVGWFAAGALAVAAIIGLFLYADGYFDKSNSVEITVDMPKVIIEGN